MLETESTWGEQVPCTKNWIFTNLPRTNNMVQTKSKSKAKIGKYRICILAYFNMGYWENAAFPIFALYLILVFTTFLHHICSNTLYWCKSNFSRSALRPEQRLSVREKLYWLRSLNTPLKWKICFYNCIVIQDRYGFGRLGPDHDVFGVAQYHPWFKLYFPWFQTHYHALLYPKRKGIKLKPGIKLNHLIYIQLHEFRC